MAFGLLARLASSTLLRARSASLVNRRINRRVTSLPRWLVGGREEFSWSRIMSISQSAPAGPAMVAFPHRVGGSQLSSVQESPSSQLAGALVTQVPVPGSQLPTPTQTFPPTQAWAAGVGAPRH